MKKNQSKTYIYFFVIPYSFAYTLGGVKDCSHDIDIYIIKEFYNQFKITLLSR